MERMIGFIGLGRMGTPMCRHLLSAGYSLAVHDLRPEAMKALEREGAAAISLKEVARVASPIILMLPDSTAVETVVEGEEGLLHHLRPGQLLIDMGTSYPPSTVRLGGLLTKKGVDFLDAPVSGGVRGAVQRTLSIMVGGEERLLSRVEPLLRNFGPNVYYLGPLGSGHTMKVINNFLSAASLLATSEAMVLATRMGLDPELAIEVLNHSTGRSYSSELKFPAFILPRTFNAGFSLGLLHKDLSLCTRLAKSREVPMYLAKLVEQVLAYGVSRGAADWDHTEMIRLLETWTGVEVRGRPATSGSPPGVEG